MGSWRNRGEYDHNKGIAMAREKTYRIRGVQKKDATPPPTSLIDVDKSRNLTPSASRDASLGEVEVAMDEVVRLTLDNDFVLWTRADDLIRERGIQSKTRDGAVSWEISPLPKRLSADQAASRGWLSLGIKALEFFGVDLRQETASRLGGWLEKKQLKLGDEDPGRLYRCALTDDFQLSALTDETPLPANEGPLLVFIHGTGSSCSGSFGALWDTSASYGKIARKELAAQYGERAFAYEHRSLTKSPIENALGLARSLPAEAEVHLVTHSRGGLVGELLCLGARSRDPDPLNNDLLQSVFTADRTIAEQLGLSPLDADAEKDRDQAYKQDREALAELRDLLDDKQLKIRRFVRVACPARGTTLASGRLDRWLSVLDHLTKGSMFGDAVDFLLAVVKERTDPRTLPGLEAMMPGSALTRLLHHPDLKVASDLCVIAGDIEGDSLWSQVKLLATDWFYGSDHDLVVNTGSMYGGIRRLDKAARYRVDKGVQVNHFNYFANARSVQWLISGLTRADDSDAGFLPIQAAAHEEPRARQAIQRSRAHAASRPLAVVIPGTMGSVLHANGEEVWLHYWRLMRGGLRRLNIDSTDVEPIDALDSFYGPLIEYLARTHRVEVFAYDWRHSVRQTAARLANKLEDWMSDMKRNDQPVHLVAHSMGGLIVRAMIGDARHGLAVWRSVCARPNSRFMMLGTPNRGSYEAVRWLTGQNPTQNKLSLLDFKHDTNDIIGIVQDFPGLLELLPFSADDEDFSDQQFWRNLKQDIKARWQPPKETTLRTARRTWELIERSPVDGERMVYVAGKQDMTVSAYQVEYYDDPFLAGRKHLSFLGTGQGDGTVTWQSGRLAGVKTWYVEDTGHDELCTQDRAFAGYLDLLSSGRTTRLPDAPPFKERAAAAESDREPMPLVPFTDDIPDEQALRGFGFGPGRPVESGKKKPGPPLLKVSIRHGDLAYAKHPVVVGHYHGDTIVSAEAALDERLQGALSKRLQLGLYPGRLNSHAIFLNTDPEAKPVGAVVVGLGQVGELSPGLLESGMRDALLDFAVQVADSRDKRFKPEEGEVRSASVSCLLVGTGAGGIPVQNAIEAILRGAVGAQNRLKKSELDNRVTIDEIEFLELYQDMAMVAAKALKDLLKDGILADSIVWPDPIVQDGDGGLRRMMFEDTPAWWHRLEIIQQQENLLRFIATTQRARAEETLVAGQLRLADDFIARASQSSSSNAEDAKTLFEMLLPQRLKELAPRQQDLVLLVDEVSARYPWELLEDRWSRSGIPPAVSNGLVRQLKTREFRPHPAHAFADTAYIVGNPNLGDWRAFPDLPGARREAQDVARLLDQRGFNILEHIDETADGILNGLHRDAWRILHLAGHGEHEFEIPTRRDCRNGRWDSDRYKGPAPSGSEHVTTTKVSGMVIGENMFLTPGDVEQMRWVPELVFINCCHLGKTLSNDSERCYNRLAANLATQFIRMGVRAVIAAGWAVDDAAAKAFATSFYSHLLDGQAFGEAVRAAREEIWTRFPGRNTWGAYQCYGDPSYQLRSDNKPPARPEPPPYHAPAELLSDLENAAIRVRMQSREPDDPSDPKTEMGKSIATLLSRIPDGKREDWLERADIAAAIGFAWGETGAYAQAVEWLDKALGSDQGECPIRAVEQNANFRVRLSADQWNLLREQPDTPEARAALGRLIADIEQAIVELDSISRRAANKERLALLGGACKRLAWMQADETPRLEALVNMANYYSEAFELSGKTAPYPFTNWAAAEILRIRLSGRWDAEHSLLNKLSGECERMLDEARKQVKEEPNYWNSVAVGDCELILMLMLGNRSNSREEKIANIYRAAARRGASPREIASVHEHLDFMIALTADKKPAWHHTALAAIRQEI